MTTRPSHNSDGSVKRKPRFRQRSDLCRFFARTRSGSGVITEFEVFEPASATMSGSICGSMSGSTIFIEPTRFAADRVLRIFVSMTWSGTVAMPEPDQVMTGELAMLDDRLGAQQSQKETVKHQK